MLPRAHYPRRSPIARGTHHPRGSEVLDEPLDRTLRGRKAAERYGFLLEGILRKHRVDSRGCNVDTALYALTNSDWRDDGVKNALEKKLRPPSEHGISASTRPVATISAEHH